MKTAPPQTLSDLNHRSTIQLLSQCLVARHLLCKQRPTLPTCQLHSAIPSCRLIKRLLRTLLWVSVAAQ